MSTNNIDIVRLLINDQEKTKYPNDDEIIQFLTINNDNVYLAAAQAIEAYCVRLSLAESFTIGSYSERANISALLKIAENYRKKVENMGVASDGSALGYDEVAEIATTEFNTAEIVKNQILRRL